MSCPAVRQRRQERRGRYGSGASGDDPERRKRSRSRDSESNCDGRGDTERRSADTDLRPAREGKTIILSRIPLHVTELEFCSLIMQRPGPRPVDVRLVLSRARKSRGFAFVEFNCSEDSTRWMETNQNNVVIQGAIIELQYSDGSRHPEENWYCVTCGVYSKQQCSKCRALQFELESLGANNVNAESREDYDIESTVQLGNISPYSTAEEIHYVLNPHADLSRSHIFLFKDRRSGLNSGHALVQLSSPLVASKLYNTSKKVSVPLDGRLITIQYAARDSQPEEDKSSLSPASADQSSASQGQVQLPPVESAPSLQAPPEMTWPPAVPPPVGMSEAPQIYQGQNYHIQEQHVGAAPVVGFSLHAPPGMTWAPTVPPPEVLSKTIHHYQSGAQGQHYYVQQQQYVGSTVVVGLGFHAPPEGTWPPALPPPVDMYKVPQHPQPAVLEQHYHVQRQPMGLSPAGGYGLYAPPGMTWPPAVPPPDVLPMVPPHYLSAVQGQASQVQPPPVEAAPIVRYDSLKAPPEMTWPPAVPPPVGMSEAPQIYQQHQVQQQQQHVGPTAPVAGYGSHAPPWLNTWAPTVPPPDVFSEQPALYQVGSAPPVQSQPPPPSHQSPVAPAAASTASPPPLTTTTTTPAAPTVQAAAVCAASTVDTTVATDTLTYQHDKESGYYKNAQTDMYYDPSSQYYFKLATQEYLYWDREKQTYVPVPADVDEEEKDEPDVESSEKPSTDSAVPHSPTNRFTDVAKSKEQDTRAESGPSTAANGGNSTEEGSSATDPEKMTDWPRRMCLLCQRQFPTKGALLRHQQFSDLHRVNLEIQETNRCTKPERKNVERKEKKPMYRDRAAERREKLGYSEPEPPIVDYKQLRDEAKSENDSIRSKMMRDIGWLRQVMDGD